MQDIKKFGVKGRAYCNTEKHTSCIEPVQIVSGAALLESGKQVLSAQDFHSSETEITLHETPN
jgi:hypothetical protein